MEDPVFIPPILSLPPEIIIDIFDHLAQTDFDTLHNLSTLSTPYLLRSSNQDPDPPSDLWRVALVCRKLRDIAISTPTLWSRLFVDLRGRQEEQHGGCRRHCAIGLDHLRVQIQRSGSVPLTLRLYVGWSSLKPTELAEFSEICQPAVQLLLSCAHRMVFINLWTDSLFTVDPISDLLTLAEFPALTGLEVDYLDDSGEDYIAMDAVENMGGYRIVSALATAKKVRKFKVEVFHERWADLALHAWSGSLVHLDVSQVPQSDLNRFLALLTHLPNLRILDVELLAWPSDEDVVGEEHLAMIISQPGPLNLPTLTTLSITGTWTIEPFQTYLFSHLITPNLTSLTLKNIAFPATWPLIASSQLRQLSILYDLDRTFTVTEILFFFTSLPFLEQLSLSTYSMATGWVHTTLESLVYNALCPILSSLQVDARDGSAAIILQLVHHRPNLQLDYNCWSLQGSTWEEEEEVQRLSESGRLSIVTRSVMTE